MLAQAEKEAASEAVVTQAVAEIKRKAADAAAATPAVKKRKQVAAKAGGGSAPMTNSPPAPAPAPAAEPKAKPKPKPKAFSKPASAPAPKAKPVTKAAVKPAPARETSADDVIRPIFAGLEATLNGVKKGKGFAQASPEQQGVLAKAAAAKMALGVVKAMRGTVDRLAHGEWEKVLEYVDKFGARDAFVSEFFAD